MQQILSLSPLTARESWLNQFTFQNNNKFICFWIAVSKLVEGTFLNASSGIRTHEAEATDLKSVPFDRSGIDANKQPNTYNSAAIFNNACSAHKLQYFVSEDYPLQAVYHLLPPLRQARF